MTALVLLLAGLAGGFASSAPIGPINLWVIDASLAGDRSRILRFTAGVIAADLVCAAIALAGVAPLLEGGAYRDPASLLGGLLLVVLGVRGLRGNGQGPRRSGPLVKAGSEFAAGALLCAGNPAFLAFWVFVANACLTAFPSAPGPVAQGLFLLGVAAGDGLWFWSLHRMVRWGSARCGDARLARVRAAASAALILAGGWLLGRPLWNFSLSR